MKTRFEILKEFSTHQSGKINCPIGTIFEWSVKRRRFISINQKEEYQFYFGSNIQPDEIFDLKDWEKKGYIKNE